MGLVQVAIKGESDARVVKRDGSVQIGRGPDNDLVLQDPEVSWRHALVYDDGGEIWVRDLGSRNGTLVDGQTIDQPVRLSVRSRIQIGTIELGVRRPPPRSVPLMLEDADTGVQHPLLRDRFVIGPDAGADLLHPKVEDAITILLPGHGEVWVGHRGEDRPIALGEALNIEGFSFVVREADPNRVPTVEASGSPYRYAVEAALDGGPGALAVVRDIATGTECRISAETRVVLLYALARQLIDDRTQDVSPIDCGWVEDRELVVAVWGRTPVPDGLARLKTLVHRIRGDLRGAGLDPWCVEKRQGHTRLRAESVSV